MRYSTQSISFFDDRVTIWPHTASEGLFLDRKVSLKEFSQWYMDSPLQVEQIQENGEFIVRAGQYFMQGPEV